MFFKKQTFTLIEIILVTLLIAIIIGVSTPVFRNFFYGFQQTNFPVDLAKLIRYAQERAIVERIRYKLKVDFTNDKYWLEAGNEPVSGRFGNKFVIPQGITIEFENTDSSFMSFYPDGRTDQKFIYITGVKGARYTLTTENRIAHISIIKEE